MLFTQLKTHQTYPGSIIPFGVWVPAAFISASVGRSWSTPVATATTILVLVPNSIKIEFGETTLVKLNCLFSSLQSFP
jgi:hypothetical protein